MLAVVGLLIAVGAFTVAIRWRAPAEIVIQPPLPTPTAGPIMVYVSGAVRAPDVYALPPGAILRDALQAAGGPAGDAEMSAVNLAERLTDGMQVHVPRVGEVALAAPAATGAAAGGIPAAGININTATGPELELLPGIGPATAEKIIAYREAYGPFTRIEDIQNVSGIGPATFAEITDFITVE
ncbi:MAG: helix-hairpin-helix domain-containing protein [Anaerolineae bacterium]|nr:helix-hairpin-helix domain-containing protein [Anaerolineae bacterium]